MPECLKQILPLAELDVAATIAANAPSGRQADRYCPPEPHGPNALPGVHVGVTCDKSGMSPIVGHRYHLVGHDYDLCQEEYDKLPAKEKELFRKVPPPPPADKKSADDQVAAGKAGAPAAAAAAGAAAQARAQAAAAQAATTGPAMEGFHPGVECDKSGMNPIIGTRFHLRGHNYDLCQAEFDKLPANEKLLYEAIAPPALGAAGPWRPGGGGWPHGRRRRLVVGRAR